MTLAARRAGQWLVRGFASLAAGHPGTRPMLGAITQPHGDYSSESEATVQAKWDWPTRDLQRGKKGALKPLTDEASLGRAWPEVRRAWPEVRRSLRVHSALTERFIRLPLFLATGNAAVVIRPKGLR